MSDDERPRKGKGKGSLNVNIDEMGSQNRKGKGKGGGGGGGGKEGTKGHSGAGINVRKGNVPKFLQEIQAKLKPSEAKRGLNEARLEDKMKKLQSCNEDDDYDFEAAVIAGGDGEQLFKERMREKEMSPERFEERMRRKALAKQGFFAAEKKREELGNVQVFFKSSKDRSKEKTSSGKSSGVAIGNKKSVTNSVAKSLEDDEDEDEEEDRDDHEGSRSSRRKSRSRSRSPLHKDKSSSGGKLDKAAILAKMNATLNGGGSEEPRRQKGGSKGREPGGLVGLTGIGEVSKPPPKNAKKQSRLSFDADDDA